MKVIDWIYKLDSSKAFIIPLSDAKQHDSTLRLLDSSRTLRAEVQQEVQQDGQANLYIFEGYSWDGCTPKFQLFGKVLGTWDGPIDKKTGKPAAYYPSLVHDVLCQFENKVPYTRKEIDKIFYSLLKYYKFPYPRLYYNAVRSYENTRSVVNTIKSWFKLR